MKIEYTPRAFHIAHFKDRCGEVCSIQESSMVEIVRPCSKSGHSIKTVSKNLAERWNLRASAPQRDI